MIFPVSETLLERNTIKLTSLLVFPVLHENNGS